MDTKSTDPVQLPTPLGPSGYPLIGNLPKMLQNPLQFLTEVTKDYGTTVKLGAMGAQQLYLVSDPDDVRYILQENSQNYIKGKNFQIIQQIIGKGLAVKEGSAWKRERRLMQPSFHRQQVGGLIALMNQTTAEMVQSWEGVKAGESLDIFSQMMNLTQTILLKSLLSIDSPEQIAEMNQIWNTAYEYLSSQLWAVVRLPLWMPTAKNRRFVKAMSQLDRIVYDIIQQRRGDDNPPGDLLAMLMAAYDSESGSGLSDEQLRDEIMTIFTGGFETSAAVLAWTLYLLDRHPEVESKLHSELDSVLGGSTPVLEDLAQLQYTRMVLSESMRLYPGAWIFTRTNLQADKIGKYQIPANSLIMISPYVTHRLPEYWSNPEEFNPEHFTKEKVAARPRYAYYPFGGGKRQCIGEVFAMTEMQLVVAAIAQKYRLSSVPEHPVEPEPMFTLRPRYGIQMTLQPRSSQENLIPRSKTAVDLENESLKL